ncbi:hypothetical protein [Thermodesulfovibrio yellowstonii]|uniref:hypothetical protein n=1 Tax=Thermodesulfovibrio yellowstonii TaxID=28262 RepID=UPI00040BC236|nr:hypothetical protein [Thermodesulfovibrio islandicus]
MTIKERIADVRMQINTVKQLQKSNLELCDAIKEKLEQMESLAKELEFLKMMKKEVQKFIKK